jgi:hypothetical protein
LLLNTPVSLSSGVFLAIVIYWEKGHRAPVRKRICRSFKS